MAESAERITEDSPTYREFSRLYDVARQLRPTGVNRWNGELYATGGHGGFDQQTGAIGVYAPLLREGLSRDGTARSRWRAPALAAVLDRATRAGMPVGSRGEVDADKLSWGLHDGVASVRAATDFQAFTAKAGYGRLAPDDTQHSGAYSAANGLIEQSSGLSVDRHELIARLNQGPAMAHFDQLAEAVLRNRLGEIAPPEGVDREAVRRELVATMLHPQWESLAGRSPEAGRHVAEEIGRSVNAKVEEIRRRGPHPALGSDSGNVPREVSGRQQRGEEGRAAQVKGDEVPAAQVKGDEVAAARFLSGMAAAAGAGRAPSLGDGSRAAARPSAPARTASQPRPTAPSRSTRT
ncbi:hypothetical protein ACIA58_38605 [Kribbella sp. NPDC051586]|uniref:hypothetical protein n=1 Tax=Kribbella sp. NPDC051586 TaxID=3364118 RepID=UPI0037BC6B55